MISVGGTFPQEARRWGMEGWTRTQFDVDADGHVRNERAIISYPPFVFTKSGTETLRTARYAKTYRPDGGLGCGALTRGVRFSLDH
nr:energy transducer TonB [Sphingomonas beigongshangi]